MSIVLPENPANWPLWSYGLVYADPPWSYNDKSTNRGGALRHYETMTDREIMDLPVDSLTEPDAVLFLWVTPPQIEVGLKVIRAWGFRYVTFGLSWVKTNKDGEIDLEKPGQGLSIGMGHHTRANLEPCLLGVRGKGLKRADASIRQTQLSPLEGHSKKPERFRSSLERLYGPQRRVELFAREIVPGWDSWGHGVFESTQAAKQAS